MKQQTIYHVKRSLTKQTANAVIHGAQKQTKAAFRHDKSAPNTNTSIMPTVYAIPANADKTPRIEGSLQRSNENKFVPMFLDSKIMLTTLHRCKWARMPPWALHWCQAMRMLPKSNWSLVQSTWEAMQWPLECLPLSLPTFVQSVRWLGPKRYSQAVDIWRKYSLNRELVETKFNDIEYSPIQVDWLGVDCIVSFGLSSELWPVSAAIKIVGNANVAPIWTSNKFFAKQASTCGK